MNQLIVIDYGYENLRGALNHQMGDDFIFYFLGTADETIRQMPKTSSPRSFSIPSIAKL
jgi:hypothetical protein